MKKLSLVFFFVLIGALAFGALVDDYDITSGTKGSVYDLGDSTLNYLINGADLISGNSGAIVSGGFHGASAPGDTPGRLASITDGLFAINGLTVIAADYGYANYDLVVEYTLPFTANVTEILIFSGHDGDGARAWINADVMIDSGGGFYTLKQNLKTGPYGQAMIGGSGNSAVAVVRLFDNSGPNARIAGSVQKIRIGFYSVSNSFVDGSFQPPGADGINGTIIKEIDVLGYEDMGVKINELNWDDVSTDNEEFVEIFGPGGLPLTGWNLEFVNGYNGLVYQTIPLTGIPPDGFLVVAGAATVPNVDLLFGAATNWMQNGNPDALRLKDSLGFVQDAIGYEMYDNGVGSLPSDAYEGPGLFGRGYGGDDAWDFSLHRATDGYDTDNNDRDFVFLPNSVGISNATPRGLLPTYEQNCDDPDGTNYGDEWWGTFEALRSTSPSLAAWLPGVSPQGGNCGLVADTTGGGNMICFMDRATTDVSIDLYAYLRPSPLPSELASHEEWKIAIRGKVDAYAYDTNYNGATGVMWKFEADDENTTLSLVERIGGVDTVHAAIPTDGTSKTGWQRLRLDCDGNNYMGIVGGSIGDTSSGEKHLGTIANGFEIGGINMGYREYVTTNSNCVWLSVDAINIKTQPSDVVPVELSIFELE